MNTRLQLLLSLSLLPLACESERPTGDVEVPAPASDEPAAVDPAPVEPSEPSEDEKKKKRVDTWIASAEAKDVETCTAEQGMTASNDLVALEKDGALENLDKATADRVSELHNQWLSCGRMEWDYDQSEDPMSGPRYQALVFSRDKISLEWPYEGPQYGALLVRRTNKGTDIMLSIERGQFMCSYDGCSLEVKFDDGPTQTWRADEPASHDTDMLFLRKESKFLKALEDAKVVRIKATFFQQGTRMFEFKGGLDTSRLAAQKKP